MFAFTSLSANSLERSVSPSQQFIIYGADAPLRGAISELGEKAKANLLGLLRRPDRWKAPIVINLQSPKANLPEIPAAALRLSQTGFGLKFQLDLIIASNIDRDAVERELLRSILLEMIYRDRPNITPGTAYIGPPDWLLDGVLSLAPGRDGRPLIEALAVSDKIISLEDFLRQSRKLSGLDSQARRLYRACSFALVRLLVDETDGPARLARYIDNLSHASNDLFADLKAQFPKLAGDDAKEIWKSNVARLSAAQNYQLLSFAETQRQLGELVRVKLSDPTHPGKALPLEDFSRVKPSRGQAVTLTKLSQDLLLLTARANPILRPTVQEYQRIAALLAAGKNKGVASRFARVQATRAKIAARMSDIDDYMNWFEATQSRTTSGVFTDYLKMARKTDASEPRRRDALSVYLDAFEE